MIQEVWANESNLYHYILERKYNSESDYPADACPAYYHKTATIDSLQVIDEINGIGNINIQ
jgi:hypothetical protein